MNYKRTSPRRSRSPVRRSPVRKSTVHSPRRSLTRKSPRMVSKNKVVAKFLSTLFHSRTQAHILHLQTPSFAGHKALDNYYTSIVPLVDKYAESYQGKYGILKGYEPMPKILQGNQSVIPYFDALEKQVTSMRSKLPKDLDLENAYADILDLIHSTQYLLKQLH